MTNDCVNSYTYDAEGNITQVGSGGSTATYVYNALNQRVRTVVGSTATEYVFNANGQRVSEWNGSTHAQIKGHYYWGAKPVAYYDTSATHFQHQDWLGTERMRTTYNGSVEGSYTSLPFGDGQAATGSDLDANHYATLDHDSETGTDHAQFRQYSNMQGRFLSPDPYSGSYDASNPQSFNRYVYASNNPLAKVDPSGLDDVDCVDNNSCPTDEDGTAGGGDGGDTGYGDGFSGPNGASAGSGINISCPNGCLIPSTTTSGCYDFKQTSNGSNNGSLVITTSLVPDAVCFPDQPLLGMSLLYPPGVTVPTGPRSGGGSAPNSGQRQQRAQAAVHNCIQQGQAAAAGVPSPAPSAQDWIEGVGVAVMGIRSGNVGGAAAGLLAGFAKVGGVRLLQHFTADVGTTQGCLNGDVYNPGSSLTGGVF